MKTIHLTQLSIPRLLGTLAAMNPFFTIIPNGSVMQLVCDDGDYAYSAHLFNVCKSEVLAELKVVEITSGNYRRIINDHIHEAACYISDKTLHNTLLTTIYYCNLTILNNIECCCQ